MPIDRPRGLFCPVCQSPTAVERSIKAIGGYITRRRFCTACYAAFSTVESVVAGSVNPSEATH